jgi:tetratricopeptide (TPR) repeat protein
MEHLSERDFEGFWNGRLDADAVRPLVHHAIRCEDCRTGLLAARPAEPSFWEHERLPEDSYDAAIDRAVRKVRKILPRLQRDGERRERGLELLREKGGWTRITGAELRSFQGAWPHIEILLQQSFDLRYRDPREMLRLAKLAQEVADRPDSQVYGESLWLDLRARAWGELGNACRVNEQYQKAESAFATAHRLLAQGTGDLFLRARLSDLEASLRRDQHRLDEALPLFDETHRTYQRLQQSQLAHRVLMKKGHCLYVAGRPLEAVKCLRKAISQLDPKLAANAQQLLIDALVQAGRFTEAGEILLKSGLRKAFAEDPLNLLRVRWVEAKILAGRGRLADAERVFEEVRSGFRARGLHYDAALAGMDLALVLTKQGKDVRPLARELHRACQAQGIHPEAVRALRSFEVLCEYRGATAERVERFRTFLDRLQHFPRLRFELEMMLVG